MDQRNSNSQAQFRGKRTPNSSQNLSSSSSNHFQQHQSMSHNSTIPSVQRPQLPNPEPPITEFNVSRRPELSPRNSGHQRALFEIRSVQDCIFGSDNKEIVVRGGSDNSHFPVIGGTIPSVTAGFSGNPMVGTGERRVIRHHQSQFMDDGSLINPESGPLGGAIPTAGFSGNSMASVGEKRIKHHQSQSLHDTCSLQPQFGVSGGAIPPMTATFDTNSMVGVNERPSIKHRRNLSMDDTSLIQLILPESNVPGRGNLPVVGAGERQRAWLHEHQSVGSISLLQLKSDAKGKAIAPETAGFAGDSVVRVGERLSIGPQPSPSDNHTKLIDPNLDPWGGALPLIHASFPGNSLVNANERPRVRHQSQLVPDASLTRPPSGVLGGAILPETNGFASTSMVGVGDTSSIQLESSLSQPQKLDPPKAMKRENKIDVAELVLTDAKRAKRILTNRRTAAMSKQRKLDHIAELEVQVKDLEENLATVSAQVDSTKTEMFNLTNENDELKQKLQTAEQEDRLRNELHEALKNQFEQLILLRQSIIGNGPEMNFEPIIGTNLQVSSSNEAMHAIEANHQVGQLHIHRPRQEQLPPSPPQQEQLPLLLQNWQDQPFLWQQQEQLPPSPHQKQQQQQQEPPLLQQNQQQQRQEELPPRQQRQEQLPPQQQQQREQLPLMQQQEPQLLNMSRQQLQGFKMLQRLQKKFARSGKMNDWKTRSN